MWLKYEITAPGIGILFKNPDRQEYNLVIITTTIIIILRGQGELDLENFVLGLG